MTTTHLPGTARTAASTTHDPATFEVLARQASAIEANVGKVISGKDDVIHLAVTTFLAGGHLLIEDVPGVGKTMLARAMATSVGASVRRIQFTSDLLPSDVTGAPVFNQAAGTFQFEPGPIFANIVIGDEINRASPRTQSALLEAMEEGQVSVDGVSYSLDDPFHVVATQNPIDMDGTYALLEAQRDRFMTRLAIGYPEQQAEKAMVQARERIDPITTISSVVTLSQVKSMIKTCQQVFVADPLASYVVALIRATRQHQALKLGASPRAAIHLLAAAKAFAALAGRSFVLPDDVQALAAPVLAHRLMALAPARGVEAAAQGRQIVREVVASVPVPVPLRAD
ncbi:MAG: MoxR family ATPase [Micrococcales bacterium]|nr:MoxR family ATPase [Micrococcales bacterium]